jgi:hypothetical protein
MLYGSSPHFSGSLLLVSLVDSFYRTKKINGRDIWKVSCSKRNVMSKAPNMAENLCAICGEKKATTVDHLPPKGIYPKPIDNDMNMHTVPACLECNGGGSKEDEEFKLFIGLATGEFRENPDKVIESLAGTMGHNKRLAAEIFKNHRNAYTHKNGLVAEKAVAISFDSSAYIAVISRIVRGLYWKENGCALGREPQVTIIPASSLSSSSAKGFKELMDALSPISLNNGTFVYKGYTSEPGDSIWGMQFFKKHTVFALTEPRKT